jgi:hypothetical protein
MKGKGHHFFSKIEPVTSIFVNHEARNRLSVLKNIAPSTPTLQKIEGSKR